jgi:hypothetical protein
MTWKTVGNPFGGSRDFITDDTCWACGVKFEEKDEPRIVDATDPKLVHDREPCRSALEPLPPEALRVPRRA